MKKEKDKADVNAKERKQKILHRLNTVGNVFATIIIGAFIIFMAWAFIEVFKSIEV